MSAGYIQKEQQRRRSSAVYSTTDEAEMEKVLERVMGKTNDIEYQHGRDRGDEETPILLY